MNTVIKERTRNKFGQLAQDFFVFKALKQEHNGLRNCFNNAEDG